MAFLDETGLNYFKRKNDETYAFKAHTHNYAGSSSAGGAATSANKLNTNAGGATTPVYFSNGVPVACTSYSNASVWHATKATNDDGGRRIDTTYLKDITSDGQSLSLVKGDGTSSTTYINKQIILRSNSNTDKGKYLKFATIDLSSDSAWGYCSGTLSFGMTEGTSVLGLLKFEFRNGSTAGVLGVGSLTWISINNIDYVSNVVAVKNSSNAYELYYKPVRDWESPSVTLLDISGTEHFQFGLGTFVDSVTPAYTSTLASCASTANSATSATNAMYIDQIAVTSADYTNWRSLIWGSPNSPTEGFTPGSSTGQLYVANTLSCQPSSGTIKATTFKGSLSGNASTATTASKLGTSTVGGTTTPIYLNNGVPTALGYTIAKSVPSNAVFTDTDTKNTAGATNTTSKIYLTGATTQAGSAQTYSNTNVWTKNGAVNALGVGNGTSYFAYVDGGSLVTRDSTQTGYLKIKLPVAWSSTMISFTVTIYNYQDGTSADYQISGYPYNTNKTWNACTATCVGKAGQKISNLTVRFGTDGTNSLIYIGENNTSWDYPQVVIHDVCVGFSANTFDSWATGWSISFTTTALTRIDHTIMNTHVGYGSATSWGNVSGKPSFSKIATSGSYNDLSNKPTIPSVGNGTVTITQNGVSKGSFTLNQSGNATIALTDTDTNTTYSAISSTDIKALFT